MVHHQQYHHRNYTKKKLLVSAITVYIWMSQITGPTDGSLLLAATALIEKLIPRPFSSKSHHHQQQRNHRTAKTSASSSSPLRVPSPMAAAIPFFSQQAIFGPPIMPPIEIPVFEPIDDDDNEDGGQSWLSFNQDDSAAMSFDGAVIESPAVSPDPVPPPMEESTPDATFEYPDYVWPTFVPPVPAMRWQLVWIQPDHHQHHHRRRPHRQQLSLAAPPKFVLNTPQEVLQTSENRFVPHRNPSSSSYSWFKSSRATLPPQRLPAIYRRYPFYLGEDNGNDTGEKMVLITRKPRLNLGLPPEETPPANKNWPHNSWYEPEVVNLKRPETFRKKPSSNGLVTDDNVNGDNEIPVVVTATPATTTTTTTTQVPEIQLVDEEQPMVPMKVVDGKLYPVSLDDADSMTPEASEKREEPDNGDSEIPPEVVWGKPENTDGTMVEHGNEGMAYIKDQGHLKHGWKNVYHKEEWGEANKYHDYWRYKDWRNRYMANSNSAGGSDSAGQK